MIFGKEEGYGLRNVIGRKETLTVLFIFIVFIVAPCILKIH